MKLPLLVLTVCYCLSPLSFAAEEEQLRTQVQRLTGIMLEQEQLLQQQAQELRQLRGDNEVIRHQLQTIESRQNDIYADIDKRLANVQAPQPQAPVLIDTEAPDATATETDTADDKTAEAKTDTKTENKAAEDEAAAVKDTKTEAETDTASDIPKAAKNLMAENEMSAEQAYKAAFDLIQIRQYPQAVLAFHMFLKQYGNSNYADNAQYWLGEAYYAQRDYPQAIAIFNELMEKYAGSPKRAHALLKSAFAYDSMNDKATSKKLLQQLRREYPNTATARLALERLQRLQAEAQ